MAIVGDKPESGFRLELQLQLERGTASGPPFTYAGSCTTPEDHHSVTVTVDAAGTATTTGLPPDLATRVRLIVQTVCKGAEGLPPRRIVRWRA